MVKFAADENFNGHVLDGLWLRVPDLDIVRIQDTEIAEADDLDVLRWAAQGQRVLLTHDVNTLIGDAYTLVKAGEPMTGVLEVRNDLPLGQVIEDILIIAECSSLEDWVNQVRYLPL